MPSARQKYGGLAEDQAVLWLQKNGFHIIARHVTSRYGEIDILARDGDMIVAVEVKARRTGQFGRAIESVTPQKLERITLALDQVMIAREVTNQSTRIDVITVEPDGLKHWRGVEA